jgi:hypothetical protein
MIVSKTFKVGPSDNLSFTGPDEAVPLTSLVIYGKSTQNGVPTPDSPVPISYVASDGTMTLTVVSGGSTQTISIPVSAGLKGINTSLAYKYLVGNGAYLVTQDGKRLLAK